MADPFDSHHVPDVEHLLAAAPLPTLAPGHEARLAARLASAASATQSAHAAGLRHSAHPPHSTQPLRTSRSGSLTWAAVAAGLLCVVALDLALPLSQAQRAPRAHASSPVVPVFFTRTSGLPTLDITTWAPHSAPLTQGHP